MPYSSIGNRGIRVGQIHVHNTVHLHGHRTSQRCSSVTPHRIHQHDDFADREDLRWTTVVVWNTGEG